MHRFQLFSALVLTLTLALAAAAAGEHSLEVVASAYNSVPEQTDDEPNIAAWGDTLTPGMRVIAVSRDLLELGLTRGVTVEIEGFTGEYQVLDVMASRWTRKIDIYMGQDIQAARKWGRQEVRIRWRSHAEPGHAP